jgi:hypothetical protein
MIPVLQAGHDRHVVGLEHIEPGRKHICQLTFVNENSSLTFAHGQFGPVFDLVAFAFKPIHQRVAGIIGPMDHIDELATEEIKNRHQTLLSVR